MKGMLTLFQSSSCQYYEENTNENLETSEWLFADGSDGNGVGWDECAHRLKKRAYGIPE